MTYCCGLSSASVSKSGSLKAGGSAAGML